jgi:hypothetical protein
MKGFKTLLLASIFAVVSFMSPAIFAQTSDPNVPQDRVIEKAKPFLGNFQAAVCDPSVKAPYGLKFNIRVDIVKDDDGKDVLQPVFKLLGASTHKIEPYDFRTIDFTEIVGDTPDKHFLWIDVENGSLVLNLQAALPNARKDFVTALNGIVETVHGAEYVLFAQRQEEPSNIDDYGYLKTLSQACPAPEQNQNQAER